MGVTNPLSGLIQQFQRRLLMNGSKRLRSSLFLLCLVGALLMVTGCGTSTLTLKPDSKVDLAQYRSLSIQTKSADGVAITDTAQNRIKDAVKTDIINVSCPKRFDSIYIDTETHPDSLLLVLDFTKYDEGNRLARMMLAGLGAMKINADVEIKDAKSVSTISKGAAGKSFAWGGVLGAATGIEDVEKMFAKEVGRGFGEMMGVEPRTN